ncbi:MAG: DUF4160 domain-containing protein [Proteobacteria bacterium]|nr:DUF4160 domain-containing protein [Pseudomonadota bacterium]
MSEYQHVKDDTFEPFDRMILESPRFEKDETGLPMLIDIVFKKGQHGPRIKVAVTHTHILDLSKTVSIDLDENGPTIKAGSGLNTKDLRLAQQFILLNRELLLEAWKRGGMSKLEMQPRLVKLP